MGQVATVQETQAAQAFLRQLGANWHDNELIVAVVAWFHQESGSIAHVLGNNPFNIRNDPSAIGYRQTKNNGRFAIFASLAAGFIAAANLLLRGGNDWRGYGLIVRAARAGRAVDFLNAIALSAWDEAHYGYNGKDLATNNLLQTYASFTGLKLAPPPAASKPRSIPVSHTPKVLNPPDITPNYIDGWAVGTFYRTRHKRLPG